MGSLCGTMPCTRGAFLITMLHQFLEGNSKLQLLQPLPFLSLLLVKKEGQPVAAVFLVQILLLTLLVFRLTPMLL